MELEIQDNYLDISPGSAAMDVIESHLSRSANVIYEQQPPVTTPPTGTGGITVYLNNQILELEDLPVIQEGRTLVPMRVF